jgi:hypothetical protein
VNTTPISADAWATRSYRIFFVTRYAIEQTNTTPNDRYASHALGTCTYIRRWMLPCVASGGATTRPMMAAVMRPAAASTPRTASARRPPSFAANRCIG